MKNRLNSRTCLNCGLDSSIRGSDFRDRDLSDLCPKCDAELFAQGNGRFLRRDIAHSHETVEQALSKMEQVIQRVWLGYETGARLVVGGGRIREEVLAQLDYYVQQGWIMRYQTESPNEGAVLVWLR